MSEAVWFTAADGGGAGAARFPDTAGGYGVGGSVPPIVSAPSNSGAAGSLSFKGWSVEVRIRCTSRPRCRGRAVLSTAVGGHTRILASRAFNTRTGRTISIRLTLGRVGRRMLRQHHPLRTRVVVRTTRQRVMLARSLVLRH